MAAFTIPGNTNYDAIPGQSASATIDTYAVNGAQLLIDTDTRYCSSHVGANTANNGSFDSPTISAALGGEIKIDGYACKIIPYKTGSGTTPNLFLGLAISGATWASGIITITTAAHSLTVGSNVSVRIGGLEPNAYNGVFDAIVGSGTTILYALTSDPGIATVTNGFMVRYYKVYQPKSLTMSDTPPVTSGLTFYGNPNNDGYRTLVGDKISELRDVMGSGRKFAQTTDANRPTLVAVDGVSVADFDGTDDFLEGTDSCTNWVTNTNWTLIAEVMPDANPSRPQTDIGNAQNGIIEQTEGELGIGAYTEANIAKAAAFSVNSGFGEEIARSGTLNVNRWQTIMGKVDSVADQVSVRIDGYTTVTTTQAGTVPITLTSAAHMLLGQNYPASAAFFNGKIKRILIYNRAVTATETTSIFNWFSGYTDITAASTAGGSIPFIATITAANHGLAVGDFITIANVTPSGYNGTFAVQTVPDSNTFTYWMGATAASGSSFGTVQKNIKSYLLGFWSAFNVPPLPTGVNGAGTVPATGYCKVKNVQGGSFTTGILTIEGGTNPVATATGAEYPGWIEVASPATGTFTIPRLGTLTATGNWFEPKTIPKVSTSITNSTTTATLTLTAHGVPIGSLITVTGAVPGAYNGTFTVATVPTADTLTYTMLSNPGMSATTQGNFVAQICTTGVVNQTVQLPASLTNTFYPGVWIETSASSGVYEFYPACNIAAAAGTVATNSSQGKVVWISVQGLLRIGNDGANNNGFVPAVGLRIRVPNIMTSLVTKAVTVGAATNIALPATIAGRFSSVTTGAGVINIDKLINNWNFTFAQPYSVALTNVAISEGMSMSEIATPLTMTNIGIGSPNAATSAAATALTMSLCFAGGTITDLIIGAHVATSGTTTQAKANITDAFDFIFNNTKISTYPIRRNASSSALTLTRVNNSSFTTFKRIGALINLTTCTDITFTAVSCADLISGTTTTTTPTHTMAITANSTNIVADGLDFFGIANVNTYLGIFNIITGAAGIKIRNIGSATTPLSLGPTNAAASFIVSAAGAGSTNIKCQRIYTSDTRTSILGTVDNSFSGMTFENCWFDAADVMTVAQLNTQVKGMRATNSTTGQTSVYGSHWQDYFPTTTTGKIVIACNEKTSSSPSSTSYTTEQLSAPSGFNSSGSVQMPLVNDQITWQTPYKIIGHTGFAVAAPTITATTALTVSAGTWSASFTTLTCGTHGLRAGDTVVVTTVTPAAYNGVFVITNIVSTTQIRYAQVSDPGAYSSGGNILQLDNIDLFYEYDGYGSFRNLKYTKTGGVTTNTTFAITMTSTAGIEVGDYVTSKIAGAGALTKVTNIDSGTQVTVDVASSATTAGNVFYFNHLPSETVADASIGFNLKVRAKSWANIQTGSITYIAIPTISSVPAQAYQYALDPVAITITCKNAATGVPVVGARVYLTADTGGPLSVGTVVFNAITDASGIAQDTAYAYTANQPITGRVRKGTSTPFYKTTQISGTITSSGLTTTIFMVADE